MRRTNRIADIFNLGSIDKVRLRISQMRDYYFSDAIFSQSAYKGDSESKKFVLFQRTYFMDGTLTKNSNIKISAIS